MDIKMPAPGVNFNVMGMVYYIITQQYKDIATDFIFYNHAESVSLIACNLIACDIPPCIPVT